MKKIITAVSTILLLIPSVSSAITVFGGGESSYQINITAGGENSQHERIKPDGGGESS